MPDPSKKGRTVRLPANVYQQLWATARLAEVPIEDVIRIALIHFARLDQSTKTGILGDFWFRGGYGPEAVGARKRLRPVIEKEPSWCALARDRIAGWLRWVHRPDPGPENRAA